MQETWVWSLVWEDPTCCRETKPMCHNYWAYALEPARHNYRAHTAQLPKPVCPRAHAQQQKKPLQGEARALPQRPSTAKNKNVLKKDVTFNEEGRREWEENFLTHLWKLHLTSGTCPDHFWCASLGRTASHMVICQHWEWSGRPDRNEDPRIPWECELNNLLKTILRPKQERIIWIKGKAIPSLGLDSTWCALPGPSYLHSY